MILVWYAPARSALVGYGLGEPSLGLAWRGVFIFSELIMTDDAEKAAEEYANFQCGLYNKRGLHPEQKLYYDYHYQGFLAGQAHERERLKQKLEKWARDNWIPHPTHDDSYWQNRFIVDLLEQLKEGQE